MRSFCILLIFLCLSANNIFGQEGVIEFSIINSSDYSIGVGSCGDPCKVYRNVEPKAEATIKILGKHQHLYIERNILGGDPVEFEISDSLRSLPADFVLIFIPNSTILIISKNDVPSIDFADKKSIFSISKGRLQLLD